MTNSPHSKIDLKEVRDRNRIAREAMAVLPTATPNLDTINAALDDTLRLISETRRLLAKLATVRRKSADLVAAARATLTAYRDAEPDHLYYVRDELRAQGHLPPEPWGRS